MILTSPAKFVICGTKKKNIDDTVWYWVRHFRLPLWNRSSEFAENLEETKLNFLYQVGFFYFFLGGGGVGVGRGWENQDCHTGLRLIKTFSTSSPKLLNEHSRNMKGSNKSTHLSNFRANWKTKSRWPHGLTLTKCRADRKTKIAGPASDFRWYFLLFLYKGWPSQHTYVGLTLAQRYWLMLALRWNITLADDSCANRRDVEPTCRLYIGPTLHHSTSTFAQSFSY